MPDVLAFPLFLGISLSLYIVLGANFAMSVRIRAMILSILFIMLYLLAYNSTMLGYPGFDKYLQEFVAKRLADNLGTQIWISSVAMDFIVTTTRTARPFFAIWIGC